LSFHLAVHVCPPARVAKLIFDGYLDRYVPVF
jgi:hypothetical protein